MNKDLQDRVWAALSNDIKKEVKKIWSVECDCAIKYKSELSQNRTELLYGLFGDNLISDAETKDELGFYEESKPVKPKYKIGQYVRYKPTGNVDVIEGITQSAPYIYRFKHMIHPGARESDIEPYTELPQKENAENEDGGTAYYMDPRLQVAATAMQGILSNPNIIMSCGCLEDNQEYITKHAVEYADALLAEINGKGGGDEWDNN